MHCRFLPVERKRQILEAASGSDDWDGKVPDSLMLNKVHVFLGVYHVFIYIYYIIIIYTYKCIIYIYYITVYQYNIFKYCMHTVNAQDSRTRGHR